MAAGAGDRVPQPGALALERYRLRTTLAQRWASLLALVLLVGVLGGLAMASVAGARRTASSFTVFWASTNPSDLEGGTGVLAPGSPIRPYDAHLISVISSLPLVRRVESQSGLNILPLAPDGAPRQGVYDFTPGPGNGYASDDGLGFNQDKVAVLQGRMADPRSPYQFMLTPAEAKVMGVRVGDVVRMGIYTNAQIAQRAFGTPKVRPYRVVRETLVGLFLSNTAVVQDQADIGTAPDNLFTPALTRPLLGCCVNYTLSAVLVSGGRRSVPVVQAEISRAIERIYPAFAQAGTFSEVGGGTIDKAQLAIKPDAIALGTFGLIVALACMAIAAQVIGRQVRLAGDERAVLRALGADARQTWLDGLSALTGAILTGALLAGLVAVVLSPLAPIGPVRAVYPDRGISLDWTVLGPGTASLALVLVAVAAGVSLRLAPHRPAAAGTASARPPSRLLAAVASSGLPAPMVTGVRFALAPGGGRTSVPVRSTLLGALLAVVALVGTATFGASLTTLVDHPALYGWNWDYLMGAGGNLPVEPTTSLLDHDPYISAWSGGYSGQLDIDGQTVPVLGEAPGTPVQPAVISGHGLARAGQVVLGQATMAALHTRVGGTVSVRAGAGAPRALLVVGTATFPAFGSTGNHLEMGVGALLDYQLLPLRSRNLFNAPQDQGPQSAVIRLKPGAGRAGLRSLQAIAQRASNPQNFGVNVVGVQKPAEILNYRSMGDTPAFLGLGLVGGAVVALGLTLGASVRRRRRELATLKSLGFSGGQLAAAVAWQSTTAVAIGVAVGSPLGAALGRWLWDLFARDINAVPAPTVPAGEVALMALGALVVANVVAALPARVAARTPTAIALRSE